MNLRFRGNSFYLRVMQFSIDDLRIFFAEPLPGWQAQMQMAPGYRPHFTDEQIQNFNPKISAVLVLFYLKNDEWHLVLIQRRAYEGVHSHQRSFPGGKQEMDETLVQTALREAKEEVGISPETVEIIGRLSSLYIPPSNFLVYPFVGILNEEKANFTKQDYEVESILEIPISFFLDEKNRTQATINPTSTTSYNVPAFDFEGHIIWGATAIMLSELIEILNKRITE